MQVRTSPPPLPISHVKLLSDCARSGRAGWRLAARRRAHGSCSSCSRKLRAACAVPRSCSLAHAKGDSLHASSQLIRNHLEISLVNKKQHRLTLEKPFVMLQRRLLTAGNDGAVKLWNFNSGCLLARAAARGGAARGGRARVRARCAARRGSGVRRGPGTAACLSGRTSTRCGRIASVLVLHRCCSSAAVRDTWLTRLH